MSAFFCNREGTENRIEHYFSCPRLQDCLLRIFRPASGGKVPVTYWFLLKLRKYDKIVMALYVHAIYTMRNTYAHTHSRIELKPSIDRLVLAVPVSNALRAYVRSLVQGFPLMCYNGRDL